MNFYTNPCDNFLTVEGPALEVKRFFEETKGLPFYYVYDDKDAEVEHERRFCFNALVPMPKEIYDHFYEPVDKDKDISLSIGAEWMVRNWGTLHDIYDYADRIQKLSSEFADDRGCVTIMFDTSILEPNNWLINVAKIFPELDFHLEYIEPCTMDYCCNYHCKGNEVNWWSNEPDEVGEIDEDDLPF